MLDPEQRPFWGTLFVKVTGFVDTQKIALLEPLDVVVIVGCRGV